MKNKEHIIKSQTSPFYEIDEHTIHERLRAIDNFVERFNNSNIPQKYHFQKVWNFNYFWEYKVKNVELSVGISSVHEGLVHLKCRRNKNLSTIITITEPQYTDIYTAVYQFLVESAKNAEALAEAEGKMKF